MSKAFKCDRCGRVVEGSSPASLQVNGITSGEAPSGEKLGSHGSNHDFELCERCSKDLADWWVTVVRSANYVGSTKSHATT
jgi:hypothetical protein